MRTKRRGRVSLKKAMCSACGVLIKSHTPGIADLVKYYENLSKLLLEMVCFDSFFFPFFSCYPYKKKKKIDGIKRYKRR